MSFSCVIKSFLILSCILKMPGCNAETTKEVCNTAFSSVSEQKSFGVISGFTKDDERSEKNANIYCNITGEGRFAETELFLYDEPPKSIDLESTEEIFTELHDKKIICLVSQIASINRITELSESDKTTDITYECGKSGLKILLLGVKTLQENSRKNEEENVGLPKAEALIAKKDDRHLQCLKETGCDGTHNNLGKVCGDATSPKRWMPNHADCSRPHCTQCCAEYYWNINVDQCQKCRKCGFTNLKSNIRTSCKEHTLENCLKSTVPVASSTTIRTPVSTTTLFPTTKSTPKSAIRTSVSYTTPFPTTTGTTPINKTKSTPMDTNTTKQSASSGPNYALIAAIVVVLILLLVVVVVAVYNRDRIKKGCSDSESDAPGGDANWHANSSDKVGINLDNSESETFKPDSVLEDSDQDSESRLLDENDQPPENEVATTH